MLKTYIQLPDGRVLSSGNAEEDAIISVTVTQCVNNGEELKTGSVCANMLECKLFGDVSICAGDRLRVWRTEEAGNTHDLGVFIAEEPTRAGAHYVKLIAYDPVVLLDRDVTALLEGLQTTSLQVLAEEVCAYCGLTLVGEELPLGQLPVSAVTGEGITGRQVLGWIGELTGHFCRATADGAVEFAWYQENTHTQIGVTNQEGIVYTQGAIAGLTGSYQEGVLTLSTGGTEAAPGVLMLSGAGDRVIGYYAGSLSFEEYAVAPVEKVQLRKSADDVGVVFPDGLEGNVNTYIVEANPLLGVLPEETLLQVAEHLYNRLQGLFYTPCKVSIPASFSVAAGDVVTLTDKKGRRIRLFVMQKTQSGQKDTIECTGSPTRDSTTAVNNRSYADLQGKVMNLRTDLEGLYLEHSNTADRTAKLELDMDGIRSQVSHQEGLQEQISRVEQTAEEMKISVEKLVDQGTDKIKTGMGYTFDDAGLKICRSDSEITNRLDETGMQVLRNADTDYETVMLKADNQGVIATDVKVRNYLVLGNYARLEDYGNGRTACFYLEGK